MANKKAPLKAKKAATSKAHVVEDHKKQPKKASGLSALKTLGKLILGDHGAKSSNSSNSSKTKKQASAASVAPAKNGVKAQPMPKTPTSKPTPKPTSLRQSRSSTSEAVCREVACEGLATSGGYCRLHYIKNWKKIKRKEIILREKKLNQYIEELVAKYPDKYIEAIKQDLATDKDFAKVIQDMDLDESLDDFDVDAESVDHLLDNIKRDFEDEGEGF